MKVAVIIGRFQPFHLGHEHLFNVALQENDMLIVALGSSNRTRSIKNPFTVAERKKMIQEWAYSQDNGIANRISFVESPDNLYKEWTWKSEIARRVKDTLPVGADCDVRLYGHNKDDSSYYLREFPEWPLRAVSNYHSIDATGIRTSYFEDGIVASYMALPVQVSEFLKAFKQTDAYRDLLADWEFFKNEKKLFAGYPFPETLNFMCSDAIVVCKGHILLIQRKHAPGKNSWALPGGFKNKNESFQTACIRELKEETNLRIPEKVLTGSIKASKMFDDPRRSLGIPRVSMGFYIEVNTDPDGTLPSIRPSSDAFRAKWVELSEAMAMNLFEDHIDLIKWFV